jgi:O-antigen/teichoic acid export membrane protein
MNLTSIRHFKSTFQGLLSEDSFRRNLAITFSGQAIGQAIGFAITPFIARTYSPETYGIFSLFVAFSTNLFSIATLQLPTGYVAARNNRELHVLLQITVFSLLFFTSLFLVTLTLFKDYVVAIFDAASLSYLLVLVPVYAFFMGIDYILLGWNIHLKEFGRGAIAKISSVVFSKGTTLLYGLLLVPSPLGLIAGSFLIYPIESCIKLSRRIRSDISSFSKISWKEMKEVFISYKSYPLFVTPGLLVASINGQLPVYFLSIYFQNSFVGFFSLANSILTVPLSVITNSTATVFLQKAAETYRDNPTQLTSLVLELFRKMFLLCFVPLTLFAFISTWAFELIFGLEWREAGWMASFFSISMILAAPQHPLSVLFRLLEKEYYNLIINVVSIGFRVIGLGIGVVSNSVQISIAGYALSSIITFVISLSIIFSMVKISPLKLVGYVGAVLIVFSLVVFQKFFT